MRKESKKVIEARADRFANLAIRGLQIPILKIPAIYKKAEEYAATNVVPEDVAVASLREFVLETISEDAA